MLFERQVEIENATVEDLQERLLNNAMKDKKRAVSGRDASCLPNGVIFTNDMYREIKTCLEEFFAEEEEKRRKSSCYKSILLPALEAYKARQESYYTKNTISHPLKVISWVMACELGSIVAKPSGYIKITAVSKDVLKAVKSTFNMGFDISNEELKGMIQLVRHYLFSSTFVIESRLACTTVVARIHPDHEELLTARGELHDMVKARIESSLAYKPMIVPPKPHKNLTGKGGGYITVDSPLLKNPEYGLDYSVGNELVKKLNKFQETAWQIDKGFFEWLIGHNFYFTQFDVSNLEVERIVRTRELTPIIEELTSELFTLRKSRKLLRESGQLTDEIGLSLFKKCNDISRQITKLEKSMKEFDSVIGKNSDLQQTFEIACEFMEFDKIYLPIFLDYRGRIFTYCSSLSFQSNNLSKSLLGLAEKRRLTKDGLNELIIALGTCFDGYDKLKSPSRIKVVNDNRKAIFDYIKNGNTEILDLIDPDNLFVASRLMYEYYHTMTNPMYETGVLVYIDSCSSGIQIQAMLQHDIEAAKLTSLINNEGDKLEDAYMAVSDICKELITEVSNDDDMTVTSKVIAYIKLNQPNRVF